MIDKKLSASIFGVVVLANLSLSMEAAQAGFSAAIDVRFSGLNSSRGQVCVNLFNGAKGYPNGGKGASLAAARCAPVTNKTSRINFTNLPYGIYAITAVHDLNGDQRANSNFLGIPTEGVAFSNNPTIRTSAPGFSETQFIVSRPKNDLQIKMNYF